MTRLRRLVLMLAFVAPFALVAGCAQGLHERCQVQSDCGAGLLCVIPEGGTVQAGGTCESGSDAGVLVGNDMAPASG
jgi:hypothetical protein